MAVEVGGVVVLCFSHSVQIEGKPCPYQKLTSLEEIQS